MKSLRICIAGLTVNWCQGTWKQDWKHFPLYCFRHTDSEPDSLLCSCDSLSVSDTYVLFFVLFYNLSAERWLLEFPHFPTPRPKKSNSPYQWIILAQVEAPEAGLAWETLARSRQWFRADWGRKLCLTKELCRCLNRLSISDFLVP